MHILVHFLSLCRCLINTFCEFYNVIIILLLKEEKKLKAHCIKCEQIFYFFQN